MSTAVYAPTLQRPVVMNSTLTLRSELQEVVRDILSLRAFTRQDGKFCTHKSQRALLARLNPQDLASVTRAIAEAETV